jgi:hypothetical protein
MHHLDPSPTYYCSIHFRVPVYPNFIIPTDPCSENQDFSYGSKFGAANSSQMDDHFLW